MTKDNATKSIESTVVADCNRTLTISKSEHVIALWAMAVRPSVRRAKPVGLDKPGESDGRTLLAKLRVQQTPGYLKAMPCLEIVYVVQAIPTRRDGLVCKRFLRSLQKSLDENPLVIDLGVVAVADFDVSVTVAVEMLHGCGLYVSEQSILEWCKPPSSIRSYKRGRIRYVRWSDVVARAPRKRKTSAPERGEKQKNAA